MAWLAQCEAGGETPRPSWPPPPWPHPPWRPEPSLASFSETENLSVNKNELLKQACMVTETGIFNNSKKYFMIKTN